MKAYTTIEESKQLIEAGLDVNTQDMYYQQCCNILTGEYEWKPFIGEHLAIKENLFSYRNGYVIPCWSLAALLNILTENNITYSLCNHILFENIIEEGIMACKQDESNMEYYTVNKTVIEAIIKFLEHGFIKKAKEGLNIE